MNNIKKIITVIKKLSENLKSSEIKCINRITNKYMIKIMNNITLFIISDH